MIHRLPALFPILVAALLALASYWLQFVVSNERVPAPSDKGFPDTIIERFHVDKFDEKGRLSMSLEAEEMKHYPKDDSADLLQARVHFLSPGRNNVWRSDKARVTERGDHIQLIDNVRGVRAATANTAERVLTTSEAILLTREEIAQITRPLTMTQDTSRIDAERGEWNNIQGLLKLWQVDATFQRTPIEQP